MTRRQSEHPGWDAVPYPTPGPVTPPRKRGRPPNERPSAVPPVSPVGDMDDGQTGMLPGSNPYDRAFMAGQITYAEAKVRDELATRQALGKIELEQAGLTLKAKQIEIDKARGELITKAELLSRQSVLVSAIGDIVQLNISSLASKIAQSDRAAVRESCEKATHRALEALADAVAACLDRDAALAAMQSAYLGRA